MQIRWTNLIVFFAVVLCFVLLVKTGPEIAAFFRMMAIINTAEQKVNWLFALGGIGVVVVALAMILTRKHY